MDPKKVIREELKILEDIKLNFELYELDDLSVEEEISEAAEIMSDACKNYRHCHVELKEHLGGHYEAKYPNYDDNVKMLTKYIKSAKSKIRKAKEENVTKKCSSEKKYLEVEVEVLKAKIVQVNAFVDVSIVQNEDEIDKYVTKMEGFINDFFNLSAKMKCFCPVDFEETFQEDFMSSIYEIQQDIKISKLLRQKIREVRDNSVKMKDLQRKQLKCINSAENLKTEISYRFKSLSQKFERDLNELGDYQILDTPRQKSRT